MPGICDHDHCAFTRTRVEDGTLHIDFIGVDAAHRGNGAGTAELRRLLAQADRRHLDVRLVADSAMGTDIARLVRWYTRHGFRPVPPAELGRVEMLRVRR